MTLDKLRRYCQDNQGKDNVTIVIGYAQNYALAVHERTDVRHKVGQAKYLETAARVNEHAVRDSIRQASLKKLPETMLKAGLLIQRESQKIVPVDTSALKASAFTCVEEELDRTATEARTRAEALRMTVLAARARRRR